MGRHRGRRLRRAGVFDAGVFKGTDKCSYIIQKANIRVRNQSRSVLLRRYIQSVHFLAEW